MPDNVHYRNLFGIEQNILGKDALSHIDPINRPALNRFTEHLKLKAYSPNTIKTYTIEFAKS